MRVARSHFRLLWKTFGDPNGGESIEDAELTLARVLVHMLLGLGAHTASRTDVQSGLHRAQIRRGENGGWPLHIREISEPCAYGRGLLPAQRAQRAQRNIDITLGNVDDRQTCRVSVIVLHVARTLAVSDDPQMIGPASGPGGGCCAIGAVTKTALLPTRACDRVVQDLFRHCREERDDIGRAVRQTGDICTEDYTLPPRGPIPLAQRAMLPLESGGLSPRKQMATCPYTWVRAFFTSNAPAAPGEPAKNLMVRVVRDGEQKVRVALPARSARWLLDLIPDEVVEKIRAEEIPLEAMMLDLSNQKELYPRQIFSLSDPSRQVDIWLE